MSTRLPQRSAAKCSFHLSLSCSASGANLITRSVVVRKAPNARIKSFVGCLCTVGDFTLVCFTIGYKTGPLLHLLLPEKIQT